MTTPTPDAAAVLAELRLGVAMDAYHMDDAQAKLDALDAAIEALTRAAPPAGPAVDAEGYERGTGKLRKALAHADGHHSVGLTKRECSAILAALAGHVPQGDPVCVGCGIPGDAEVWCAPCRRQHIRDATERSRMDTMRLDWLDKNPRVVIRSGKQHVRPLIDAAMLAQEYDPQEPA